MTTQNYTVSEAARRVARSIELGRFQPTSNMFVRTVKGVSRPRFDTLGKIANITGVPSSTLRSMNNTGLAGYITTLNLASSFTGILETISDLNDSFVRNAHYNTSSIPGKRLIGELMHLANKYDQFVRETASTKNRTVAVKNKKTK